MYLYKYLTVLLLLLLPTAFANEDVNKAEYLDLTITNEVSASIDLEPDYRIDFLKMNSYFFPIDDGMSQTLFDFQTTSNNYRLVEDINSIYIEHDLTESVSAENTITNIFSIQSQIHRPQIREVVPYPSNEELDKELNEYLGFSGLVTTDSSIRAKASSITQGEDDTFVIAAKIAQWIQQNVEYDLSTIEENPDQSASEVFQSREGVCQEVTILFASMMRSLGIPTRVVTGYAYTTSEELEQFLGDNWGGHAWAEAYIDGKWVPFDLTYNQYGYVDASHIILDVHNDIRADAVSLNGSGVGIRDVKVGSDVSFEIDEISSRTFEPDFSISLDGTKEIGYDSHGYINASITNNQNYYQVLFFYVATTTEVELNSNKEHMIIFKPDEEKDVIIPFQISGDQLQPNMIYTIPFLIQNQFFSERIDITVQEQFERIHENDIPQFEQRDEISIHNGLGLLCYGEFAIPENEISCSLNNANSKQVSGELCVENNCESFNLNSNEQEKITLYSSSLNTQVSIDINGYSSFQYIPIKTPSIEDNTVLTGDQLKGSISHSFSEELTLEVSIGNETISQISNQILIDKQLPAGEHTLSIKLYFEDTLLDEQTRTINVPEITLIDRMIQWIRNFISKF